MTHAELRDFFASRPRRIHLIGVAGSGMSGIAGLLLALGHRVSGSDKSESIEVSRLKALGLDFHRPHNVECVADAELVIYSSAIKSGNVSYDEALRLSLPLARRADALAAIMANKRGIVVCGMHGKTTTSAMAAHVMRHCGCKSSHYVGAEIPILGTNAHWDDEGEFFVAEGDESDGTLINYHPAHAIVLNIEPEHLDFYRDLAAIDAVFNKLLTQTSDTVFYCGDDEGARRVCAKRKDAISYGKGKTNDYHLTDLVAENFTTRFRAWHAHRLLGEIQLNIPGAHNASNALAVIALASEMGLPFEKIAEALESFSGARRRFEIRYKTEYNIVVDDYGHHPTEIAATVATARTGGWERILAMFQPHRYTRTQALREEFGKAFGGVDYLAVTEVYAASEKPIPGISGLTITEAAQAHGHEAAIFHDDIATLHRVVGNHLRDGDLIMSLGAGNIHEAGMRLVADLEMRDRIRAAMGAGTITLYEPLAKHTTFRVGGPAQFWAQPKTAEGLAALARFCSKANIPIMVMGRGSNLLVRDGGIPGVVAHLASGEFADLEAFSCSPTAYEGKHCTITAGAGVRLNKIVAAARDAGIGGLEWMEGIPASLGGALRMNAGAMGSEIFHHVVNVRVCDRKGFFHTLAPAEMKIHYRDAETLRDCCVVSATLRGRPDTPKAIEARLHAAQEKRRVSQPRSASAGCFFKNPPEIPAGKLIEELGFKGFTVGGARVSEKHANFIVNNGTATAVDVLTLAQEICTAALREREIPLELEVQVVGED